MRMIFPIIHPILLSSLVICGSSRAYHNTVNYLHATLKTRDEYYACLEIRICLRLFRSTHVDVIPVIERKHKESHRKIACLESTCSTVAFLCRTFHTKRFRTSPTWTRILTMQPDEKIEHDIYHRAPVTEFAAWNYATDNLALQLTRMCDK